jgi:beta-N-acetylhexosaminidase
LFDDPARHPSVPRAVVFGCAGPTLSPAERDFFAAANPLGFCLFARNCQEPAQLRDLVAALRDSIGRGDAPILIDQEGGRVARLTPPHWRRIPAAARLAELPQAEEAVRLAMRLVADDLAQLGITIDAAPVLDLPVPGADAVIGDRAYGSDPMTVAALGLAACEGLLGGGVLPILKHIPGHGRATVDSHRDCPRVATERELLDETDFAPFRALAAMPWAMPWAMTAHVVFTAIDPDEPATLSPRVVGEVIRGAIGFDGVLISDDLSMGALGGGLGERAAKASAAGCDVALHCNGERAEMEAVAEHTPPLSEAGATRVLRGEARRLGSRRDFDRAAAEARLAELTGR